MPVAKAVAADSVGEFGRAGTRVKLQGLRRKIAEHMAESTRTIPHFHYVDECNVTDLVHTRVGLRDLYAKQNVKLTYLAFFVKAVVGALKKFPAVNASIGCAPCTRATLPGEDVRAGRFYWETPDQKECGLHVNAEGKLVRKGA